MPAKPLSTDLMFKAFADPTRLRILVLLSGGELCVGDLVDVLQVPQPSASRHLAYLRRSGLVTTRKEGLWIYYGLTEAKSAFHKALLNCLNCCFEQVPEIRQDQTRMNKLKKRGGCC